jgi:isoleucyl-tRNA synthetase
MTTIDNKMNTNTDTDANTDSDPTYSKHEDIICKKWKSENTYLNLMKNRNATDRPLFRFVDGPPFVSGQLHLGHTLVSYLKSSFAFYKMMMGFKISNKLGFDVHGLPSENYASKELNLKTKQDIENYGLAKFNAFCKNFINNTANSWEPKYDIFGRWCDFNDTYKTMDINFMESVWWTFGQLWKKNLVYRGVKVMAFSCECGTSLSNFEAGQLYEEVNTKTVYVYFPISNEKDIGFAVWTTTPWTLSANLVLCVNPNGIYVKVFDKNNNRWCVVLESCINNLGFDDPIIEPYKLGKDIVGTKYAPIFMHLSNMILQEAKNSGYYVISDNYVTMDGDIGTGIVHVAPSHGEDDFRIVQENNIANHDLISKLCQVDDTGCYTNLMGKKLCGKFVMDNETTVALIIKMKKRNALIKTHMHKHSYPFCYRTKKPLIYKTVSSFFIEVTKIKDDVIKNNKKVNWHPSHIGSGRFDKWLNNIRDWGVSRSRFFGTPIPVWISEDKEEMICISSISELKQHMNEDIILSDIHPEFIWPLEFTSKKSGKKMICVKETFDCWFESGSVPISQLHYPFNDKTRDNLNNLKDDDCLTDFICEGVDQCRGWFYTLMVLSTAIFNKPAYKNVICSGLILAADGRKLSKSLGNFTDPLETIKKFGSDYVRLYMLSSPATKADTLCFNEEHVYITKQKIIPWINSITYLLEHLHNFKSTHAFHINSYEKSQNVMDKWIMSNLGHNVLKKVIYHMDNYEIDQSIKISVEYIETITNWYIRLNRDRLKGNNGDDEWMMSLSTLFNVQINFCLMIAPFMPFLAEHVFLKLHPNKDDTVFSYRYPCVESFVKDEISERKITHLQDIICIIRQLRQESDFSTSVKPIKNIIITSTDKEILEDIKILEDIVMSETNVLSVEYKLIDTIEDTFCTFTIVPVMKNLGKKFRKNAKHVVEFFKFFPQDVIKKIHNMDHTIFINDEQLIKGDDFNIIITPKKCNEGENLITKINDSFVVQMDTTTNETTQNLYMLRLLIKNIQNIRKTSGLHPWNKINIYFHCIDENIHQMFTENHEFLKDKLGYQTIGKNLSDLDNCVSFWLCDTTVHCQIDKLD